jgi:hypothetical protein
MFGPDRSKLAGLPFLSVAQPATATSDPIRCLSCPAGGLTAQHAQQPTSRPSTPSSQLPLHSASTAHARDASQRRLLPLAYATRRSRRSSLPFHVRTQDAVAASDTPSLHGPVQRPQLGPARQPRARKREGTQSPLQLPSSSSPTARSPFLLYLYRRPEQSRP